MTRFEGSAGGCRLRPHLQSDPALARSKGLVNDRLTIVDSTHVTAKVDTARLAKFKQGDDDHKYVDRNSPDSDARFGRKSKNKGFYGDKDHLAIDADNAIITAVETTPGNVPDGNVLPKLITGKPKSVTADKAYDAGPNYECLAKKEIKSAIIPVRRSPERPPKAERERPKIEAKFGFAKASSRQGTLSLAGVDQSLGAGVTNLFGGQSEAIDVSVSAAFGGVLCLRAKN